MSDHTYERKRALSTGIFFDLKQHLYWVSYRDRYDVEPWQGQGHGYNGMIELYLENKDKYAGKIKKHIEKEMDRKISKKEFHRIMKYLIHKSKM